MASANFSPNECYSKKQNKPLERPMLQPEVQLFSNTTQKAYLLTFKPLLPEQVLVVNQDSKEIEPDEPEKRKTVTVTRISLQSSAQGLCPFSIPCLTKLTSCFRRKHRRTRPPSPVKRALASDPPLSSEVDCPAELDPQDIATPEHAKLKGTVWPGMALFDAATSDMRRKRNQKKDGSVLRKMERLATMVQPFEAVYSPTGELKKARHIDDLEDASSLIEGETPIPKSKQTRARKRLPLAEKNANAPRLVKRKLKTEDSMTVIQRSGNELPSLPYLPSSSTVESYSLGVRFLPSEDEDVDLKPRMSPMVNGRRPATFKIFNDGSPTYNGKGSTAEDGSGLPENLRPQLSASTAPWLQPQQQNALQYTNPYSSQPHLQREYSPFYHHAQHKENIMPSTTPTARLGVHTVNPLSWRSPLRDSHDIGLATESAFENFLGLFPTPTQSDDPFVVTRNPFAQALPHFGVSENMLIKQD